MPSKKITKKTSKRVAKKVTKKKASNGNKKLTFFNDILARFYIENKGTIWKYYKAPTKKFLEFLNPDNGGSLRRPQYNAFEIYVFLKEFCSNEPVSRIFKDWDEGLGRFENLPRFSTYQDQMDLFASEFKEESFKEIINTINSIDQLSYSNYIYALSMGVGKTRLMACCIFYEFTLSKLHPNDPRYCHNALVFAPDKTVLTALREIQTTDKSKLIPPEFYAQIDPLLKFEYLTDTNSHIQAMAGSNFNIIVSNNQKIIVKQNNTPRTGLDKLFSEEKKTVAANDVMSVYKDLGFLNPADTSQLNYNQRLEKLCLLPNLGVFVDEAHHAFGGSKSTLDSNKDSSLRMTIHYLAKTIKEKLGSQLVACHHFTGTPYVGQDKVLPEVVYNLGLIEAIKGKYLKDVRIESFSEMQHRNRDFLEKVVDSFLENTKNVDAEGMRPKLAIFSATIKELQEEVRPALEKILQARRISLDEILVNVGDVSVTKEEDIKEFDRLDTVDSKKRFILLVNKGTEGWNCRSLFGVALNRSPGSTIFVLQSTMRCLRSIGESQQIGHIYVSDENQVILDSELKKNLGINIDDIKKLNDGRVEKLVKPSPPPVSFTIKRLIYKYRTEKNEIKNGFKLGLDEVNTDLYKVIKTVRKGIEDPELLNHRPNQTQDISDSVSKVKYTKITLIAEIARYMSMKCLDVQNILEQTKEGVEGCLDIVNKYNSTLYGEIVPRLFKALYNVKSETEIIDSHVELIKPPTNESGGWTFRNKPELFFDKEEAKEKAKKSFHVSPYSFDSSQEKRLLWYLLDDDQVENVWFTGMFTHGQSDFHVQYIDSESNTVCNYYPDFLIKKRSGEYVLVEVKAANLMDEQRNIDKANFARTLAEANRIKYHMIAHSDVDAGMYRRLLE